jgi:hypothetical protein
MELKGVKMIKGDIQIPYSNEKSKKIVLAIRCVEITRTIENEEFYQNVKQIAIKKE